jgi:hypothetical protein
MNQRYSQYKNLINTKDIRDIMSICKILGISQKTAYGTVEIYHRYMIATHRCENIISMIAACIMLTGKISNALRSAQKILQACHSYFGVGEDEQAFDENYRDTIDIEMRICIGIDFDLQIQDYYGSLEELCKEYDVDKATAQCIWIILNDTVYLPLVLAFCTRSVVVGCMAVANMIDQGRDNKECDLNGFRNKYGNIEFDDPEVEFIIDEIVSLYENFVSDRASQR